MKMKICLVWILLLCAGFSLFAQSDNASISFYVPQVSGTGIKAEDNSLFTSAIIFELMTRNYYIVRNEGETNFSLKGTITPWTSNAPRQTSGSSLYALHLLLSDSKTGKILTEQSLVYASWEEASGLIPVMVSNILAVVHTELNNTAWQNKRLYFGAAAFWTPRIYTASSNSIVPMNFGFGISAEVRLLDFLSLGSGMEIAPDWIAATSKADDNYLDMVMEIPLTVKFVFKPSAIFLCEPYAGIHLNFPLYNTTKPPLLSWRVGFQYGFKAGQGVLFIEPRFAMDIGDSTVETRSEDLKYHRNIMYLSLGYKYGFLSR
ncbi:MAG: hypothetical protein LBB72_05740 [Spirochaetaceae bacterium]|jgi:hypothetical protein|nr:hypothetical protein [Spirochaetaceae bacterium]